MSANKIITAAVSRFAAQGCCAERSNHGRRRHPQCLPAGYTGIIRALHAGLLYHGLEAARKRIFSLTPASAQKPEQP